MIIDGKEIANKILAHLKEEIEKGIKEKDIDPPKLVIFSVKPGDETLSYMRNKEKAAKKIGAEFELIKYKSAPRFESFAKRISMVAHRDNVHGLVIQEPLPPSVSTVTLFDYIPIEKEIEGFKKKSPFEYPIGLAALTAIKKTFSPEDMTQVENLIINLEKDLVFFKTIFKRKKIVLLGRGKTGGKPIGEALTKAKISYINLNSQTIQNADIFLKQADIIISAVGKKIINPSSLKQNVALYSIGMRKEKGKWKGDYEDKEIEDIALAYTPTPGGIGPINVAYLLYNLVQAWKIQNKLK